MTTTVITLLSGFAGSLITLIITKALDFFQSKQQQEFETKKDQRDFDQELKKQFFARKLEVAEDFMKALTQLSSACEGTAQMYRSIQEGHSMADLDSGKIMMQQSQHNFQAAMKSLGEKGGIIDMYFDLNANPLAEVSMGNFDLPMRFEMCAREANALWNDAQQKNQANAPDANEATEAAKNKIQEMQALAADLEKMYLDMMSSCGQLTQALRANVKKFDY